MFRRPLVLGALVLSAALGISTRVDADIDVARALDCSHFQAGGYAHASGGQLSLYESFTLEAWVKAAPSQPLSPYPVVVVKPSGNVLNGDANYGFIVVAATGNVYFRVTTSTGSANALWTGNLLDGQWHYLAGVRDKSAGEVRFYVDGTLVSTVPCGFYATVSSYDLDFGGLVTPGYTGNALVGQIDEVRLWNVTRTASDIQSDRLRQFNWEPGLLAVWHFDVLHAIGNPSGDAFERVEDSTGSTDDSATLENDATLEPSDAPIIRGFRMEPLEIFGRAAYPMEASLQCVAPGADSTWLTVEWYGSPGSDGGDLLPAWAQLDVLGRQGSGGLDRLGVTPLAYGGDALMTNSDRGWVAWTITPSGLPGSSPFTGAVDIDLGDPGAPIGIADTTALVTVVRLIADPAHARQGYRLQSGASLTTPGKWSQSLSLVDLTTLGHDHVIRQLDLSSFPHPVSDAAASGDIVYIAFPDSVREFARIYVGIDQQQFLQRRSASIAINDGMPFGDSLGAAVATCGHYLYVAGIGSVPALQIYDITNPDAPMWMQSVELADDVPQGVSASGRYAYIAGPNGVQAVDVFDPTHPLWTGYWITDMPTVGSPPLWAAGREVVVADGVGGLYRISNDAAAITAVADAPMAPVVTALSGAPNPFHGAVTLRYTLARAGDATLAVFDVGGRLLRRVTAGTAAGEHRWVWDGRDDSGRPVAAGVYLARLETPRAQITCRLVELGGL